MNSENSELISFRDKISTISDSGKRKWVYAQKPRGAFYFKRQIFGYSLLILFFTLPFIRIQGEQIFLLDVFERKFVLFGTVFMPQDFYLFYLMMVSFIVFIVLFTVMFGRLFCGWACPQTLFLEMLFRPIEWLIEGNPKKQQKLDSQELHFEKFFKKGIKYILYVSISLLVVNTLLSYIIGSKAVLSIMSDPISEHIVGFAAMIIVSGAFLFIYSRFREQVCTLMCPYGRLQSVMIDSDTIQVSYDYFRGEPRGPARKNESEQVKRGDCIDCGECVRVCPTAIDIRNGSQLECINCTACMDACNAVMIKTKRPKGLIRYSSENGLKSGKSFKLKPRNIAYTGVLIGILIFFTVSIFNRSVTQTTILRARNIEYQITARGEVANLYTIDILNKSNKDIQAQIKLKSPAGRIEIFGNDLKLKANSETKASMLVYINNNTMKTSNVPVEFEVYSDNRLTETINLNFLGPEK